jgi:hypothetical protein
MLLASSGFKSKPSKTSAWSRQLAKLPTDFFTWLEDEGDFSSEMSVAFWQTAGCYISEDETLYICRSYKLKS